MFQVSGAEGQEEAVGSEGCGVGPVGCAVRWWKAEEGQQVKVTGLTPPLWGLL